jgi:hypothetical protein
MWLLADITSWAMFIVGLGMLISILLRRWHRYYGPRRRRREAPVLERTAREERKAGRSLSDAPVDVLRWHVELHETARDLKAELESKITALQVLIRMAGQEADRLERLIDSADSRSKNEDT